MQTLIKIYPRFDALYYGYYIAGLKAVSGEQRIIFSTKDFEQRLNGGLAFTHGSTPEQRVFIDARDGSQVDQSALKWCDVYGKVNVDKDTNNIDGGSKIISIGPNFGIRHWRLFPAFLVGLMNYSRLRLPISESREHFANYWRQAIYRLPISMYKPTPSQPDYVFFLSSLWKQEPETNRLRANFIAACRSVGVLKFEGGFAPRANEDVKGFESETVNARYLLEEYLVKTKRSAVVFNTPAVGGCHGWKLAEFLALGKAIVSTPLVRSLPAPLLHGKHLHISDGSVLSLRDAIEKVCGDQAYRLRLEEGAREYYRRYLAPECVISRLLSQRQ